MSQNLKFIFVHGLSGWGSYDKVDRYFPYWGLSGGSVIKYLRKLGYEAYNASVSPTASAWDRACELYAQLAGTIVDYGKEHSKRSNHERFGKDFTNQPLIQDFENSTIVLIGHSFGGATVRLFSELLINGSKTERDYNYNDISPLFTGKSKAKIFALVTLAAPTNGTTSYDLHEDPTYDIHNIEIPSKYEKLNILMSKQIGKSNSNVKHFDKASYDMHIDHALELNKKITVFNDIYYFSYACNSSVKLEDGSYEPNPKITESMFMKSAILMSKYKGHTKSGIIIDEKWQMNDGLVNVYSALAPIGAPQCEFVDGEKIEKGIWYKMPLVTGDHMYFQGGMTKRVKIKPFYKELLEMISNLE